MHFLRIESDDININDIFIITILQIIHCERPGCHYEWYNINSAEPNPSIINWVITQLHPYRPFTLQARLRPSALHP